MCMYIYNIRMYMHRYLHVLTCIQINVYENVCTGMHIHIYIQVSIYTHAQGHIDIIQVCTQYTCKCIYTHIDMYVSMHI